MIIIFLRLFIILLISVLPVSSVSAEVKIGDVVPDCRLDLLSTKDATSNLQLSQLHGQVVYVDFWASWCPPCLKSFPFLSQLQTKLKAKGFRVIGVNLDEEITDAESFANRYPVEFTLVVDSDKQCAKDFNVIAMPSSYLIDRKGVIRKIHHGFRLDEVGEIQAAIERVLAESF